MTHFSLRADLDTDFPTIIAALNPAQACHPAPTAPVRARRTDPITSHRAAAAAARFAGSHAGRILAALIDHGPGTAHQIAARTGLQVVQIDRRLPELAGINRARLVLDTYGEPVVCGGARVWEAVR